MSKRKNLNEDEICKALAECTDSEFDSDDSCADPMWIPENFSDDELRCSDLDENINEILVNLELEENEIENESANCTQFGQSETVEWKEFQSRQKVFPFVGKHGLQKDIPANITPMDAFSLFVDEKIIDHIVTETNRYAEQVVNSTTRTRYARINKWMPTDREEIKKFLGLILWMGLVKLGTLPAYWSTKGVYNQEIPRKTMPRNRFQLLLSLIHFSNNEISTSGDRLRKIQPLMDMLQKNFKEILYPGEDIVVDETLVPWRGRLIFRQYIPNKAHKYGIKLFKLCSTEGYTWAMKIYSGKSATGVRETGLARNVCEELAEGLLNQGRTLYVDNFYTSYDLAKSFLNRSTHVVGTLRANTKYISKEVLNAKLQKGEMIAREDPNGIVVLKWRDTRDVRLLSTKHAPVMIQTQHIHSTSSQPSRSQVSDSTVQPSTSNAQQFPVLQPINSPVQQRRSGRLKPSKPLGITAYNKGKAGIDLSDQMTSYATTLRKGVKWYRKLATEALLGISVVNAWVIYKLVTKKNIQIREFREEIAGAFLDLPNQNSRRRPPCANVHVLQVRTDENAKKIRRKCVLCYAEISKNEGRQAARKKAKMVYTYCKDCPNSPQICLECFGNYHRK